MGSFLNIAHFVRRALQQLAHTWVVHGRLRVENSGIGLEPDADLLRQNFRQVAFQRDLLRLRLVAQPTLEIRLRFLDALIHQTFGILRGKHHAHPFPGLFDGIHHVGVVRANAVRIELRRIQLVLQTLLVRQNARNTALHRQLHHGGIAIQLLHQMAADLHQTIDRLDHMHGDTDRTGLVGNSAGDGLADPPGRVGGELVAFAVVELFDRAQQAHVAFLDQIHQRQAAIHVLFGHTDDQP